MMNPKPYIVLMAVCFGLISLGGLGLVFLVCRPMQNEAESLQEALIPVMRQISRLNTWVSLDINRRKEFSLGLAGTTELVETEEEIRRTLMELDRALKAGDRHGEIFSKLEKECRALAEAYDHCRVAAGLTYGSRNLMMAELDRVVTRQLDLHEHIQRAISAENVYLNQYPAARGSETGLYHASLELLEFERHLLEVLTLITQAVSEMNHHHLTGVELLLPVIIEKAGEANEANGGEETWLIEKAESFENSVKSLTLRTRAWMQHYERQRREDERLLTNLMDLEKWTRQQLEVSIQNLHRTARMVEGLVFVGCLIAIVIFSALLVWAVVLQNHKALNIYPRSDERWPLIPTEVEEGKNGLTYPSDPGPGR